MKKIVILVAFLSLLFIVTGCEKKTEKDTKENKKEITGTIVDAILDENNNIIINKEDITEKVTYISYEYEGIVIGLLAVKDSRGNVKVVVNTCSSCGGAPNAYFIQVGDKIQCQNCGNLFAIEELDNLEENGCNPISIEELSEIDDKIIIGTEQLNNLKEKFKNWNGPKK